MVCIFLQDMRTEHLAVQLPLLMKLISLKGRHTLLTACITMNSVYLMYQREVTSDIFSSHCCCPCQQNSHAEIKFNTGNKSVFSVIQQQLSKTTQTVCVQGCNVAVDTSYLHLHLDAQDTALGFIMSTLISSSTRLIFVIICVTSALFTCELH